MGNASSGFIRMSDSPTSPEKNLTIPTPHKYLHRMNSVNSYFFQTQTTLMMHGLAYDFDATNLITLTCNYFGQNTEDGKVNAKEGLAGLALLWSSARLLQDVLTEGGEVLNAWNQSVEVVAESSSLDKARHDLIINWHHRWMCNKTQLRKISDGIKAMESSRSFWFKRSFLKTLHHEIERTTALNATINVLHKQTLELQDNFDGFAKHKELAFALKKGVEAQPLTNSLEVMESLHSIWVLLNDWDGTLKNWELIAIISRISNCLRENVI